MLIVTFKTLDENIITDWPDAEVVPQEGDTVWLSPTAQYTILSRDWQNSRSVSLYVVQL